MKGILNIFFSILILLYLISGVRAEERIVNLKGMELCPNSAASVVMEETSKLKTDDILIFIIETENKYLITSAIKREKIPVTYEEIIDNGTAKILIRNK